MAKMIRAQFLKMIAQRQAQKKGGKKDRLTPGDTTDASLGAGRKKYGNARFAKLSAKGHTRA